MNPAAPVTKIRTAPSLVRSLVLALLVVLLLVLRGRRRETLLHRSERATNLGPLRLERLRTLKVGARLRAAAELQQRVPEVVVRVPLVRVRGPGALQALHGLLEQGQGLRVLALLHERPAPVVERVRIGRELSRAGRLRL